MTDWTDEYKARMRDFLAKNAHPVQINPNARYDFEEVSTYGWRDYDAEVHCKAVKGDNYYGGCHWIVPEGAEVRERTYSQFAGTFSDNENEVGINVSGCHCACGKYTDTVLRFTGSLQQVIAALTRESGVADPPLVTL